MHTFSKARHTKLVIYHNLKFDRASKLEEKGGLLLYWSPNKYDNGTLNICLILFHLKRTNKGHAAKEYQILLQLPYTNIGLCLRFMRECHLASQIIITALRKVSTCSWPQH